MLGAGILWRGSYGAPLPVGESFMYFPLASAGPATFSAALFLVDLAVTWLLLYALARWSGPLGASLAILGPIVATMAALIADPRGGAAYLPLPLRADDALRPLTQWTDLMLWSSAGAVVGWLMKKARSPRRR